jgi:hypothetical protein
LENQKSLSNLLEIFELVDTIPEKPEYHHQAFLPRARAAGTCFPQVMKKKH